MAETNPQAGVEQPSIQDRMSSFLAQSEDQAQEPAPEQEQAPQQQPESQAEPEDVEAPASAETEAEAEQPAVETFKIVHNGQEVALSLAEVIENAQQGYDYTRKNQTLAEKQRIADERLQRIAQVEQMTPHLQNHLAQVKALEAQLQPYQNVDWVALAQDPTLYAQHQAQYLTLQRAYQGAVGQYQQAREGVNQQMTALQRQRLAEEDAQLPNYIPEWKDPAKKDAGKAELVKYFTGLGVSPALLNAKLDDAVSVSIAYKAMKWDQLQKSKTDTSKTLRKAPPVTVPGAAQSGTAKADKEKQLQSRLKKTGTREDAMAVLLNRL